MNLSAEDKLEIQEHLARAAYAYDVRDTAMLENCFSADASMSMRIADGDLIGPFEGRGAIMGLMNNSMAEQSDVRKHIVSNLFFELGDDGEVLAISNLTLVATEGGEIKLLSAAFYRDTMIRGEDGWLIHRRHVELDKSY